MELRPRKKNTNANTPIPLKRISTTKKSVNKKVNTKKNNATSLTASEGTGQGTDSTNAINNNASGLTAGGGSGTINTPINKINFNDYGIDDSESDSDNDVDNSDSDADTTNDEKNKKVILGVRVMPTANKNSKGYMVNGIQFFTKYNDLPYSNIDSVNLWLDNFFKYIKKQGFTVKKNDENDETDEIIKEHDDITYFVIDPIKYNDVIDKKAYISTKNSGKTTVKANDKPVRTIKNGILLGGRKKSKTRKNRKTLKNKKN
uniref:Uncharacterized protein n=1 Tax=viral metagenome TaxID=1070528 RepID=A0A6C0DMU2_9ZZZZ